jgi:hypothetical protein
MADPGIKKATILNEDLPIINFNVGGYGVRYRIVSEDRNRTSHWSPIHRLGVNYTYVPGQIKISKTADIVQVIWDKADIFNGTSLISKIRDYDVWVKWGKAGAGDWQYTGNLQANSTSFIIPNSYLLNGVIQNERPNQFSIEVFLENTPASRSNTAFLLYTIALESV